MLLNRRYVFIEACKTTPVLIDKTKQLKEKRTKPASQEAYSHFNHTQNYACNILVRILTQQQWPPTDFLPIRNVAKTKTKKSFYLSQVGVKAWTGKFPETLTPPNFETEWGDKSRN